MQLAPIPTLPVLASALIFFLLAGAGCSRSRAVPPPDPAAAETSAARGAQLVLLGACDDCHTPMLPQGAPNMARRFSGHAAGSALPPAMPAVAGVVTELNSAWRGPWGLSIARNITPDPNHGIGKWSLQDFIKTMRTGTNPAGHALLPPMPVAAYGKLPDADLTAIYAFLRTVPPSANAVTGP